MTGPRNDGARADDPVLDDSRRWEELGWGDPTSMSAFMSVLRLQKRIVDNAHAALEGLGLSITDFAALVFLGLSPGHQQPLGKIAQRLLIGPGRCSYVIDHLEGAGLVERQKHPDDKRTVLAVLTPHGVECLELALERMASINYGFGEVEPSALEDLVELLVTARGAAGDVDQEPRQST